MPRRTRAELAEGRDPSDRLLAAIAAHADMMTSAPGLANRQDLARSDRELGALAASLASGCAYCANVHARQHLALTGSSAALAATWTGHRATLCERDAAILEFAEALSATPPRADAGHVRKLRDCGMNTIEIVDLVHAIAIFGWANRLMHRLGSSAK